MEKRHVFLFYFLPSNTYVPSDGFAVWFCGCFFKLTKQQLVQQNKPYVL